MGGRGSSSGQAVRALVSQFGGQPMTATSGVWDSQLALAPFQTMSDYTDNGNPQLVKWQGQTDDKSARFLDKVWRDTDLDQIQADTNDPWRFYNNPQQKLVEQLGLNKPTTVLTDKQFDRYIAETGSTVLYRGWSGDNAVDRFKNSPNSHIGTGINGDGYYATASRDTAENYGNTITRMALSPQARVVSIDAVRVEMVNHNIRFNQALDRAGSVGERSYGVNQGDAQLALKMGYNVIDAGWAVIPLTRDAVVVSNKTIHL